MSHLGIPKPLVLRFKQDFGSDTFVETGTFRGTTTRWASEHFGRVVSIEASEKIYREAKARLHGQKNIELFLGSSDEILPRIAETLTSPTVFWLDGHWSGGETYGEQFECPVQGELCALQSTANINLILIDDASYFLAPPPRPHRPEQWPSIAELLKALQAFRVPQHLIVLHDTIIIAPIEIQEWLTHCVQDFRMQASEMPPYNFRHLLRKFLRT